MFVTKDRILVYERRDWGAAPPRGGYLTQPYLRSLVYHHGGPVGKPRMTKAAAASTVKSWQAYHQLNNGWIDIGYHMLMDGLGRLYLGRPVTALGAHVAEQNTGRVGLCFMQDGRFYGLTWGQKRTMRKLIRVRHDKLGLPALKDLYSHPGSDWGVWGHDEVPGQSTECPGSLIKSDVRRLLREGA